MTRFVLLARKFSLKRWHIVAVGLLVFFLAAGTVAYAQRPNQKKVSAAKLSHQSTSNFSAEAFLKQGTTLYAGSYGSWQNPVSIGTNPVAVLTTQFRVPNGYKADLIATFSGEVGYEGSEQSGGGCIGYLQVDNYYMFPEESYLTNVANAWGGAYANTSMQGLGTVKKGNHTVYFVVYADDYADAPCTVYNRTLTVIANVHK